MASVSHFCIIYLVAARNHKKVLTNRKIYTVHVSSGKLIMAIVITAGHLPPYQEKNFYFSFY